MSQHVIILCPVFNDGNSFNILQKNLLEAFKSVPDMKLSLWFRTMALPSH